MVKFERIGTKWKKNNPLNDTGEHKGKLRSRTQSVSWNKITIDQIGAVAGDGNIIDFIVNNISQEFETPIELSCDRLDVISRRHRGGGKYSNNTNDSNDDQTDAKNENPDHSFVNQFTAALNSMTTASRTHKRIHCCRYFRFPQCPSSLIELSHLIPNLDDPYARDMLNFVKYNLEYFYVVRERAWNDNKFPVGTAGKVSLRFCYKPIGAIYRVSHYDSKKEHDLPDVVESGKLIFNALKKAGVITFGSADYDGKTGETIINAEKNENASEIRMNYSQALFYLNTLARSMTVLQCDALLLFVDCHTINRGRYRLVTLKKGMPDMIDSGDLTQAGNRRKQKCCSGANC